MSKLTYILTRIIQSSILQHILFWIFSFGSLLYLFKMGEEITKLDMVYTFLFHFSLVMGVAINVWLLIPFFLKKERYFLFVILLTAVWLAMAEFNEFTFNILSDILFPDYLFVSEYSFSQLLVFSFAYLALSTLLKLSKSWFAITKMQQQMAVLQQEQAEAELMALKANINPHFLFNNLNTLYALARKQSDKTPEYILKLSELMRYMLYETTEKQVNLNSELQYISNYIALQQMRCGNAITIDYSIAAPSQPLCIAPFLLIPFVENSFKHGGLNAQNNNSIQLKIDAADRQLQFYLTNTVPQYKSTQKKAGGFGIENVRKRLQKLYPNQHELKIDNDNQQFTVQLTINLQPINNESRN